jgi:hypothetical protein
MTAAREFLDQALQKWPRLPDSKLAECTEEEKAFVRGMEENAIQLEFVQLSDIVMSCGNKFQFAKTYKVLRADLKNFAKGNLGDPRWPARVNRAMRQAFIGVGKNKLHHMAQWFFISCSDKHDHALVMAVLNKGEYRPELAIEQYAGKDDERGCSKYLLLLAAIVIGGPLAYWLL